MILRADVVLYGGGSASASDRVQEILAGIDVTARVGTVEGSGRRGVELVLVSVPVTLLFEQLEDASHSQATAARTLADLAESIAAGADAAACLVMLQDTETGIQIVVGPGVPEAAFGRLATTDLSTYTFGPLLYSGVANAWQSPMDEWASS